MTLQSTRDLIFFNRGLKEGAIYIQQLAEFRGLHDFLRLSQEYIDRAEDAEFRFIAEVKKTSKPPEALL